MRTPQVGSTTTTLHTTRPRFPDPCEEHHSTPGSLEIAVPAHCPRQLRPYFPDAVRPASPVQYRHANRPVQSVRDCSPCAANSFPRPAADRLRVQENHPPTAAGKATTADAAPIGPQAGIDRFTRYLARKRTEGRTRSLLLPRDPAPATARPRDRRGRRPARARIPWMLQRSYLVEVGAPRSSRSRTPRPTLGRGHHPTRRSDYLIR
ncbi:hypothetical protein FrEUN1fDRAFT_8038 [Parafrankia sp. EUN1f]|nr:hypothetical protein FrEUN1fDRAFT_8038 [Parafrankia sp. EUN1f]